MTASVHRILEATGVYRIEQGVPLNETRGRPTKYPFGDMGVGDSFTAPKSEANSLRCGASLFATRNGQKFTIRTTGPDQVRCWRIK